MENSQGNKISEQCRICMIKKPIMVGFQEHLIPNGDITILNALEKVMGCKILISERTPQNICTECLSLLQKSYNLKTKYERMQQFLLGSAVENLQNLWKLQIGGTLGGNNVDIEDYSNFVRDFNKILGNNVDVIGETPKDEIRNDGAEEEPIKFETIIIEVTKREKTDSRKFQDYTFESIPLKCDFCLYRTDKCTNLKKHSINVHGRMKTYQCRFCNHTAYSRSHYERHETFHKTKLKNTSNLKSTEDVQEMEVEVDIKEEFMVSNEEIIVKLEGENEQMGRDEEASLVLNNVDDGEKLHGTGSKLHIKKSSSLKRKPRKRQLNETKTSDSNEQIPPSDLNAYHESYDEDGMKHYNCNVCLFKSTSIHNFRKHVFRIHKRRNMRTCRLCAYSAALDEDIQRHIKRVHHRIRDYKCEYCDYSAVTSSELQSHVDNIHLKIFRLGCEYCDYRTNKPRNLTLHVRKTHGRTSRYKCDACKYSTFIEQLLEQHKNFVHLKERKFKCNVCEYKAFTEAFLNRHTLNAHKERACPFAYCDYKSKYKSHVDRHVKHMHAGEEIGDESEF